MLEDFTYDSLLQICKGVQGRAKVKEKKIDYQHCKECNVERMMYPHLGFYVCPNCAVCCDDIFITGYNESMVKHKKRKCIYNRDEYFQSKIRKFLCREPLEIPDRVMRLLEEELHNSDNMLYYYS